jgi:3-keto-5-aminohexanoate cleavage enzyme
MTKTVIIALAPTSGSGIGGGNPVFPEEIADQVIQCAKAGASIVHMHARDEKGQLTTDMTCFNKTVELIRSSCDIIVEASTGGLSSMTAVERTLPAKNPQAQIASLNIGSLNFGDRVYQNSLPDIRLWIKIMSELKIKPSLEIFDAGNMHCALHLIQEGLLTPPCNFSFVCNLNWGMPYHPALISYLRDQVPTGSHWGANLINSSDFKNHIEVAKLGGSVLRVGFEDSRRYNGKIAENNLELVLGLRTELESNGFSIASVSEARAVLLK